MNLKTTLFFFLVIIVIACNPSNTKIEGDTWIDLFDGVTLDGFSKLNGEAQYKIDNGEIVGITTPNTPNTFLATDKKYKDFVLELEYKVDPAINSGIQIRSNSLPEYQDGRVHGYQVEIDPSERAWSAGIYDEGRRGWLYPLTLNPKARKAFRQNDWNKVYIECLGNTIKTWLNDVPTTCLVDDVTAEGFIALQVHSIGNDSLAGKEIRWKNIKINTENITPRKGAFPYVVNTMNNNLSEAEKNLGWKLAWDGKTTEGWRMAHGDKFPTEEWEIKDGILTVLESEDKELNNDKDIVTEEEFKAFEFQLDFMITEGANSGIKYFVTEEYETNNGAAIGLEFQILDDEKHPDATLGKDGNRTLASLYDLMTAEKQARYVRKPGEWNHARIVVNTDNTVEHWLNHNKVLTYTKGSPEFLALVKMSKYKDWEGFGLWKSGHILLQDHGNQVSFKNIKVRKL